MLIRIALLFALSAFVSLVFTKLLIALSIPLLPEMVTRLALIALFSSFAIFSTIGVFSISKWLLLNLRIFFSAPQRNIRRLLFIQCRQNQIQQTFHFQTLQIKYFHELKRKKLLDTDNKRQMKALSAAVGKELAAMRKNMPKDLFKELQLKCRDCQKRQDSNGLLQLQQTIANLKQHDNDKKMGNQSS